MTYLSAPRHGGRRPAGRRQPARFVVLVALLVVVAAGVARTEPGHAAAPAVVVHRPNVLVFVADDQTRNTVTPQIMPSVYQYMVAGGESFPNFTDADPLCCPSRASIMTGRFNHNNHVYSNDKRSPLNIDLRSTIQCYIQEAGYRTAFYGKFLNGFPITFHQPCLTDYAINGGQAHEGRPISVNGTIVHPSGWLDEYDLGRAKRFLDTGERHDREPWYLYFADSYPHSPYVPRPEHDQYVAPPPGTIGPAVGEQDVSDKPPFVQVHSGGNPNPTQTIENELKMLATVDDHFAALIADLQADGELQNTLIIYVSDNGYLFGEHGLWGKANPYLESTNVPMLIRWPGHITPNTSDPRQAQNIDLAPTIVQATGIKPTRRYPYDGRSLLNTWQRPVMLNESFHLPWEVKGHWEPAWRSIHTTTYDYVEWRADGRIIGREYYDLTQDPDELTNLLRDGDPTNNPDTPPLHAQILRLATCVGAGCR